MRISTSLLFNQSLNRMLDLQTDVARYNEQVSTGRRVRAPSDDPSVAARVVEIDDRVSTLEQYQRNIDAVRARLTGQESALDTTQNLFARVQELILQGKNGSLANPDRRALAAELRERLNELVDVSNARNESGEFIFAGSRVGVQPFTRDASGTVQYTGDQSGREIKISDTRRVREGFSGFDVFLDVRNGNGTFQNDIDPANTGSGRIVPLAVTDPTAVVPEDFAIVFTAPDSYDVINETTGTTVLAAQPFVEGAAIAFNGIEVAIEGAPEAGDRFTVTPSRNQSVFETLSEVISALETGYIDPASQARFTQTMDNAIDETDAAIEKMLEVRAAIGGRLNAIDAQQVANEDFVTQLTAAKSSFQDVDLVEAVGRLTRATTTLQAAQATFARVQGLSLFNFLR